MTRRAGLRAFPPRGGFKRQKDQSGSRLAIGSVRIDNVVFDGINGRKRYLIDALSDYFVTIAVSHPKMFARLLSACFVEEVREFCRERGLPIPRR
jgi:hypothetical protein